MARWIVAVVVVAMVFPLAACKRTTGEARKYDREIDPPASLVSVTIDPNIKEKQEPFNNTLTASPMAMPSVTPAAPRPSTTETTPSSEDAQTTEEETTGPAEATSLIDVSVPKDDAPEETEGGLE